MKTRKHLMLAALGLSAVMTAGQFASAQEGKPEGRPGKERPQGERPEGGQRGPRGPMMEILQQLDLSDAQREKIRPIMQDTMKQLGELRQDTKLDEKAKRQKMREIIEASQVKIRKELTSEQAKKFDELVEKAKAERGPGGPGGPGGPREGGREGGPGKGKGDKPKN